MHYALIMAGGAGTRLWPVSREHMPKPALRLYSDESMFQIAVKRLDPLFKPEDIYIVAGKDHSQVLSEQVPNIPLGNFINEPMGRGTAPAIGLAAVHLATKDPDAIMAVLTADHHIGNEDVFRQVIAQAIEAAKADYLVTLGINPTWPSPEYGYIEEGERLSEFENFRAYKAEQFVEKPNSAKAQKMLALGNYSCNSGMFVWKVSRILEEFRIQMPVLHENLMRIATSLKEGNYDEVLAECWPEIEKQTIDYGIMENAKRVAVIPVDMDWLDVGNWASLKTLLPTDGLGNSLRGDIILEESSGNLVIGDKRLIAGIGLEDLIIVDTSDTLLVIHKEHVGAVRGLVERLKREGREDLA